MKKIYLSIALLALGALSYAQEVKHSYLGVKLGMNYSKISFDPSVTGIETKYKPGFAGGIYYNLALGKVFSIQPELLYSGMGSYVNKTDILGSAGETKFKLGYASVPILFKVSPVWRLGLFAGPQFDLMTFANSEVGSSGKVDLKSKVSGFDFAGTAGLEFWFTRNIGLWGRYIYGFTNINNKEDAGIPFYSTQITSETKNRGWQFGLTIGMRSNAKPAPKVVDTDGDGIADPNDKCPDKAGTAAYLGCPVPDSDGDGINDENDKCPNLVGTAKYAGCPVPDTDGDGINDENDKCPNKAGVEKYAGCPVPDADGDGINDENDKCPNQAGTAKYVGCPIPDTDSDGVNDEQDKCPSTAGIADNLGCPEMVLKYKISEAKLSADDKTLLDGVVTFMNNNPSVNIVVEGHACTIGGTEFNQKLSEQRAANSVKYLVSKGVDAGRMSSVGYGELSPVADNTTEEGRAQNRITVIKIAK